MNLSILLEWQDRWYNSYMHPRIKQELDREDFRMRRLRSRAYGLRLNRTAAEAEIYNYLVPGYEFQFPLLDYIIDFVNVEREVAVEIDGGYHLAQPRKDANRMWTLYCTCGLSTIRFVNEEVLRDVEKSVARLREFEANPIPPTAWVESEEERQRKVDRKVELKEIARRFSAFENQAIGKTRKEAYTLFGYMQPKDNLDVEVLSRIQERLYFWPEEGYAAPGLQRITARKLIVNSS